MKIIQRLKKKMRNSDVCMIRILYSVLKWIVISIRHLRNRYLELISPSIPILQKEDIQFKKLYHIKDETIEEEKMFKRYNLFDSAIVRLYHPAQDILEIESASVFTNSDIVRTKHGIFWEKKHFENFPAAIPADSNLLFFNDNTIVLKKNKHLLTRDICFSMLGVWAEHWGHFLLQYLCKLYYMKEAGLFENKITILFPDYQDHQIRQIVSEFISGFPQVNCEYIDADTEVKCNKLIFVPTTSIQTNTVKHLSIIDGVIPKCVTDRLKFYLVDPLVAKSNTAYIRSSKIYLVRRGMDNKRTLINYKEIEAYFTSLGFQLVEPHLLSLEEKVSVFSNASIVVGPFGSAFSNLIFCKKKTKVLLFYSFAFIEDTFISGITKNLDLDVLSVMGNDEKDHIHSSYTINLNKIKSAYKDLLNG
jgi:capsular polysaccharide biosynthesis protein